MALKPDELAREIAATREDMGDRIVELRRRGETAARRTVRIAIVAAATGAAIGAAVVVGVIAYRVSRPPTTRERVSRVVPSGLLQRAELMWRRGVPAVRLYVNDAPVGGEKPPPTSVERLVRLAARTAGTAAGTALAGVLIRRVTGRKSG